MANGHDKAMGKAAQRQSTDAAVRVSGVEDALHVLDRIQALTDGEMMAIVGGYGDWWEGNKDVVSRSISGSAALPKIG